jgi:hypothetical protein
MRDAREGGWADRDSSLLFLVRGSLAHRCLGEVVRIEDVEVRRAVASDVDWRLGAPPLHPGDVIHQPLVGAGRDTIHRICRTPRVTASRQHATAFRSARRRPWQGR